MQQSGHADIWLVEDNRIVSERNLDEYASFGLFCTLPQLWHLGWL
jgi:hypothetical protein